MKTVIFLIICAFLTNCATKVTTQGNKTRQIDESWKKSCKHLGNEKTYSTFKLGSKGNYLNVQNNIKNITAEKGGNAYFVNDFSGDGLGHFGAVFEVYDCPNEKYKVPAKYEQLEKLQELYKKGILTTDEYNLEKEKLLDSHD